MTTRIRAFRSTFNLLLSVVELMIGIRFVLMFFGSDSTISWVLEDVRSILSQMGGASSILVESQTVSGSAAFLVMVLGFMIFSYVLMFIVPLIVAKKEKEMKLEIGFDSD